MYIDNTVSMTRWMLAEILTLLFGIAFIIYSMMTPELTPLVLGVSCFVVHVLLLVYSPCYFHYNDEKDPLEIRSVTAFPLFRKYRQYGILKKTIQSYEITQGMFGLQKFLTITIKGLDPQTKKSTVKKIEKINISILKKTAVEDLERTLKKYVK